MSCGEECLRSRWRTEEPLSAEQTEWAWKMFSYFENKCHYISSPCLWPRAIITWLYHQLELALYVNPSGRRSCKSAFIAFMSHV